MKKVPMFFLVFALVLCFLQTAYAADGDFSYLIISDNLKVSYDGETVGPVGSYFSGTTVLGKASDGFTANAFWGFSKKAYMTIAVYDAKGALAHFQSGLFTTAGDVTLKGYPLTDYTYKVLCWDESFIPLWKEFSTK